MRGMERLLSRIAPLARIGFWLAFVFSSVMAVIARPPQLAAEEGDKIWHILAFLTLTVLAQIGFRGTPRWRIAERLCLFGAVIEVVQSIPALNRSCDIRDLIADAMVVLIVTGGFVLRDRLVAEPRARA